MEKFSKSGTQAKAAESLELFNTVALPMEPISVRIAVAMALTGLGRTKIYELIKLEELATAKAGTSTLVIVASLKDYILRSTQK